MRKKQGGRMEPDGQIAKRTGKTTDIVYQGPDWLKLAGFLDEGKCRDEILHSLHPQGACCPACMATLSRISSQRFWAAKRVRCAGCGKFFTATSGTVFDGWRVDFRELALMFFLVTLGIPGGRIADILHRDPDTIRWRLRKIFPESNAGGR